MEPADLERFVVRPSLQHLRDVASSSEVFVCKLPSEAVVMDTAGVLRTYPVWKAHMREQREARATLTPGSLRLLITLGAYQTISVRG